MRLLFPAAIALALLFPSSSIAAATGPNGSLLNHAMLPLGGALDVNRSGAVDCMGSPAFDYDPRFLVAVEGDKPETLPNRGTFGSTWDLVQTTEANRLVYHTAENCASGDRKAGCLTSSDTTDFMTMAAAQSETWGVSIVCSLTFVYDGAGLSHISWDSGVTSSNRAFNTTSGPRIALHGASSGSGATAPEWVSLCIDMTDPTSVDIAVNGVVTYSGLNLDGVNGNNEPDQFTVNAFAPTGGGATSGGYFGRIVGYNVDPGKSLVELSTCLSEQWGPVYDVGEPYVDFDARYLAGADASAIATVANRGTGSAVYGLAQATGTDQPLLRAKGSCSGAATAPCMHFVDATDDMTGGIAGGTWTSAVMCATMFFPETGGTLWPFSHSTAGSVATAYVTSTDSFQVAQTTYSNSISVPSGWHTICFDPMNLDEEVYVDGVASGTLEFGTPVAPLAFELGTYGAGAGDAIDFEIGRIWAYNEDPGVSLADLSLRGQRAWGFPRPAPPSNFVCRLDPTDLKDTYADGDPVTAWPATADSTKTTECDQAQVSGVAQPTHTESCSEFNGESCADFDGGDWLDGAVWSTALTFPYSICGVSSRDAIGVGAIFGSPTSNQYTYLSYELSDRVYYFDFTPSGGTADYFYPTSNTTFGAGDSFCLSFDADGDATLYLNNVDAIVGDLPGHTRDFTGIELGSHGSGAAYLDGTISEIVVYDREIASEVSSWYSYTCTRYGLGC